MMRATAKTWKAIVAATDNDSLASVRGCMQSFGYETERVRSPEAIVPALSGRTRAVVIVSTSFPELDAARLCRDVRAAARSVHVIFLLDPNSEEAIELAFEAGADDVLTEPIAEVELRARLGIATRVLDLEEYRNRMRGEGALLAEIAREHDATQSALSRDRARPRSSIAHSDSPTPSASCLPRRSGATSTSEWSERTANCSASIYAIAWIG